MPRIPLPISGPVDVPNLDLPAPGASAAQLAKGFGGPPAGNLPGVSVVKDGPNNMGQTRGFMRDVGAETAALRAQQAAAISMGSSISNMAQDFASPLQEAALHTATVRNDADVMVADSGARKAWVDFQRSRPEDPANWAKIWGDRLNSYGEAIQKDETLSPVAKEKIALNILEFKAKTEEHLGLESLRREASLAKAKALSSIQSDVEMGHADSALQKIAALKANGSLTDHQANSLATGLAKKSEINHWFSQIETNPVGALAALKDTLPAGDLLTQDPNNKKAKSTLNSIEHKRMIKIAQASLSKAQAGFTKQLSAELPNIHTEDDLENRLTNAPLTEDQKQEYRYRWADNQPPDSTENRLILELADQAGKLTAQNDPEGEKANTIRQRAAIALPGALGWLDKILPKAREDTLSEDQLFRMGKSYIDGHYLDVDPRPTAESDSRRLSDIHLLDSFLERRKTSGTPATRQETIDFLSKDLGVRTDNPLVPLPGDVNPAKVQPMTKAQTETARLLSEKLGIKPAVSDFAARHGMADSLAITQMRNTRIGQAMGARMDSALAGSDDAAVHEILGLSRGMSDDFRLDLYSRLYRADMAKAGIGTGGVSQADIDSHLSQVLKTIDTSDPLKVREAIRGAAQYNARQTKRAISADLARAIALDGTGKPKSLEEWMAGLSKVDPKAPIRAKPLTGGSDLMADPDIKAVVDQALANANAKAANYEALKESLKDPKALQALSQALETALRGKAAKAPEAAAPTQKSQAEILARLTELLKDPKNLEALSAAIPQLLTK